MHNLLIAAVLGTVQGVTEFLPISSTAHLVIFEKLFGLDQRVYGLSFDMFTSLGTTVALILYFRQDLLALVRAIRLPSTQRPLKTEEKVPWWILGITVLVAIAGYFMEGYIEDSFRTLPIIAGTLILFGVIMIFAERQARRQQNAPLTAARAYSVGLAQILAFVPGVSRSGATISTGLFLGLKREEAARFSFLLSVPIFLAAIAKRMLSMREEIAAGLPGNVIAFYIVGFLFSAVIGYFSIHFLLRYLKNHPLTVFAYYRFLLAAIIIVALYI